MRISVYIRFFSRIIGFVRKKTRSPVTEMCKVYGESGLLSCLFSIVCWNSTRQNILKWNTSDAGFCNLLNLFLLLCWFSVLFFKIYIYIYNNNDRICLISNTWNKGIMSRVTTRAGAVGWFTLQQQSCINSLRSELSSNKARYLYRHSPDVRGYIW